MIQPATPDFAYPTVALEIDRIPGLCQDLLDLGIAYGLGSKIEPISLQAPDLAGNGITAVDCSGFVRWAIWHASKAATPKYPTAMPDGSYNQGAWTRTLACKESTPDDALDKDGILRIAFLSAAQGGGIGHVLLILDGKTYESYGHADGHNNGRGGPGSREWLSEGWMRSMEVYVLAVPEGS